MGALVCSIIYLFAKMYAVTPQDQEIYHQLLMSVEGEAAQLSSLPSTQKRTGLRKDVFFHKEGKPQHLKILGDFSELRLKKNEDHLELVEQMNGVKCYLEEELSSDVPIKSVYFLETDQALYSYKTENLVADQVNLRRFLSKGQLWEDTQGPIHSLVLGKAAKVACTQKAEGTCLEAEGFEASLIPDPASFSQLLPSDPFENSSKEPILIHSAYAQFEDGSIELRGKAVVEHLPARFEADKITLFLTDPEDETFENDADCFVERIVADQNVRLEYGNKYTLKGDHALYLRTPPLPTSLLSSLQA